MDDEKTPAELAEYIGNLIEDTEDPRFIHTFNDKEETFEVANVEGSIITLNVFRQGGIHQVYEVVIRES